MGNVIETKLLHPWKTPVPNDVTPLGIFSSFKLEHPLNAEFPIDTTSSGIVILDNFLQLEKVDGSMEVTDDGIVTDSK